MSTHSLTFASKGRAEIFLGIPFLTQKQQKWYDITSENKSWSVTAFSSFDLLLCGKTCCHVGTFPVERLECKELCLWEQPVGTWALQPSALWLSYLTAGSFRPLQLPATSNGYFMRLRGRPNQLNSSEFLIYKNDEIVNIFCKTLSLGYFFNVTTDN